MKIEENETEITTRVISGKFRGKKLRLPSLEVTRSTKSLVKGSLFDTLGSDTINSNFIEVFAGSGSIGIEALSRGAGKVHCIERDRGSFSILKDNFDSLKDCDKNSYALHNGDSFDLLRDIYTNIDGSAIFYVDPPFNTRDGFSSIYGDIIIMINSIPKNKILKLIIEHSSEISFGSDLKLELVKQKKFGKTTLSYYQP